MTAILLFMKKLGVKNYVLENSIKRILWGQICSTSIQRIYINCTDYDKKLLKANFDSKIFLNRNTLIQLVPYRGKDK